MVMENKKSISQKTKSKSKKLELASLITADNKTAIKDYEELNWTGTFWDYVEILEENPHFARNAYQRLYDMIMSHGTHEKTYCKRKYVKYDFFGGLGDISIYGLEENLMEFMDILKSASKHYGPERRVILLHGPVGSSKSTIVTALKKGLENYSRTDGGALYSFSWKIKDENNHTKLVPCPMNEEPLKLLPTDVRNEIVGKLNDKLSESDYCIKLDGDLNPVNEYYYNLLMDKYNGDYRKVLDHVVVRRVVLSEKNRVGIGTFQPKDEKSQDATELTGDINYRKLAEYGSESDPRAFDFNGEFLVSNRGVIEFQEILKLQTEFLYDLLGATQEHRVKPRRFSQVPIDEVILGHTNNAEFEKLANNKFMEALRDRTIKIDIPYLLKIDDEKRIYDHFYNQGTVSKHIAPHTTYLAALFAVVSRLEESSKHDMSIIQKAKLYNGQSVHGFTDEHVKEMQEESPKEGLYGGVSARFIQNQFSNAIVNPRMGAKSLNPFMLFAQIREGLKSHTGLQSEDTKKTMMERLELVEKEYDRIVKREVQQALSSSEEAIKALCTNYIDNIVAYIQDEKVTNPVTGKEETANEQLMRSIEEKIGISNGMKDDFRREIMNYMGGLAAKGKEFKYDSNEQLYKALEKKLFEDTKDSIKLSALAQDTATVVDKELLEKIDALKQRLITSFGYDADSASDVLTYVGSIFARGDADDDEE
jgi:serine protein kinase